MRYTPKQKVEQLLSQAGYTREGSTRGWTKSVKEQAAPQRTTCIVFSANGKNAPVKAQPRFHALITDGEIDLHIDKVHGHTHRSKKFTPPVIDEIHRLEHLDMELQ